MFAGLGPHTLNAASASSTSQHTFLFSSFQAFLISELLSWMSWLVPQSPLSPLLSSSSFAGNLTGLVHTLIPLGQDAALSRNPCSSHVQCSVIGACDLSIIIWLSLSSFCRNILSYL